MKMIMRANSEASLLKTNELDPKKVESALHVLMKRHFDFNVESHPLKIKERYCFDVIESTSLSDDEIENYCNTVSAHLHSDSDFIISVGLIKQTVCDNDLLFFAVHRKYADRIAWRVLVSELYALYYDQALPAKYNHYREWQYSLSAYARDPRVLENHLDYWRRTVDKMHLYSTPFLLKKESALHRMHLMSIEKSKLRINDLDSEVQCLHALLSAIASVFQQKQIPMMLSDTGRAHLYTSVDPARLVGHCSMVYPAVWDVTEDVNQTIKQKNAAPSSGISYHALHLFHKDDAVKNALSLDSVPFYFQYLGEYDQLDPSVNWRVDTRIPGSMSAFSHYHYGLAASFFVVDQMLHVQIDYQDNFIDQHAVKWLCEKIQVQLGSTAVSMRQNSHHMMHRRSIKHYDPFLILNAEKVQTIPIIFVPPGGGGAESYLTALQSEKTEKNNRIILLNNYLKDSGDLTHLPSSFESLAAVYIDQLLHLSIAQGVRLAGYSFGAVLAFEMANQLESHGITVKDLYLIDPVFVGDFIHLDERVQYQSLRRDIEFIAHYRVNEKPCPDAAIHFFKSTHSVCFGENPDINEQKIMQALSHPLNGLILPNARTYTLHTLDADHYQLLSAPFVDSIMASIFDEQG